MISTWTAGAVNGVEPLFHEGLPYKAWILPHAHNDAGGIPYSILRKTIFDRFHHFSHKDDRRFQRRFVPIQGA